MNFYYPSALHLLVKVVPVLIISVTTQKFLIFHILGSERIKVLPGEVCSTLYWKKDLLVFEMEACAAIGKHTGAYTSKPCSLFGSCTNSL